MSLLTRLRTALVSRPATPPAEVLPPVLPVPHADTPAHLLPVGWLRGKPLTRQEDLYLLEQQRARREAVERDLRRREAGQ